MRVKNRSVLNVGVRIGGAALAQVARTEVLLVVVRKARELIAADTGVRIQLGFLAALAGLLGVVRAIREHVGLCAPGVGAGPLLGAFPVKIKIEQQLGALAGIHLVEPAEYPEGTLVQMLVFDRL